MYNTLYITEFGQTFKTWYTQVVKKFIKSFIFQLHKGQTVEEQLIGSCGWLTYVSDLVLL